MRGQSAGQYLAIRPAGPYVSEMIDGLMTLLRGREEAVPENPEDRQDAVRTALAALLVEAAHADGVYLDDERATIERVLADRFALSADEAHHLRTAGEAAQAGAVDLVRFTRVLKEAVPFEERVGLIEAVWRVVYADRENHHEEAALVRKLAGLLYVSDKDTGLARQRVVAGL